MNYRDTVINNLKSCPIIFPNRIAVDDHLFATIGNGYEWANGELVEEYVLSKEEKEAIDAEVDAEIKRLQSMCSSHTENVNDDTVSDEQALARYNDYSFDNFKHFFDRRTKRGIIESNISIYTICHYSSICNIPDNIKKDWLDAAENFVDFCLNHTDALDHDGLDDQLKLLQDAKARILSLKK